MPGEPTGSQSALLFVENVGQFDDGARFQVLGASGGPLWLADDGLWLTVLEHKAAEPRAALEAHQPPSPPASGRAGVHLDVSFEGANPAPRLEPFDRQETSVSYFLGDDPTKWRPDVPVWGGVRYVDLYPGIDLEVTSRDGQWIWRMVQRSDVDAASAMANVRLQVTGAKAVAVEGDHLRLTTAVGEARLPLIGSAAPSPAPMTPQTAIDSSSGTTFTIAHPFALAVQAATPALAPAALNSLAYSTFLGGSTYDFGNDMVVNAAGNAYVIGATNVTNFPTTPGSFDTSFNGVYDAFVVKLNLAGNGLVYATFLGGVNNDGGTGISIDAEGNAYVIGYTNSTDFPATPDSFDSSHNGGYDAFVVKLDPAGTGLVYGTFIGGKLVAGDNHDYPNDILVDAMGNAYVAGFTNSTDFPTTPGAYDRTNSGARDGFVVKLNSSGDGLDYATYLGGSSYNDSAIDIAIDSAGNAYVVGSTYCSGFPSTPGSYDTVCNGTTDGFVVKLKPTGSDLVYATFLGGSFYDSAGSIAIDTEGNAYISGSTASLTLLGDFPTTPGAYNTTYNGGRNDAYIVKLNPTGTDLVYATYLGGDDGDYAGEIIIDTAGNAYVAGGTLSTNFPTTSGAYDSSHNGSSDSFVVKLNASGTGLMYATYFGGTAGDGLGLIALDARGNIYIAGSTDSTDFPTTPGAYDTSHNGSTDAIVAKLGNKFIPANQNYLPYLAK